MLSVRLRTALCSLLAAALLCSLLPCAFAEGSDSAALTVSDSAESTVEPATESPTDSPSVSVTPLWPSAEAAIRALLDEYAIDDSSVGLAYYNTVTGEEYTLNPDEYRIAASLYKVPLNMVYAERVASGELDPESEISGYPYRTLMEETLINSDNDLAAVLRYQFGDYTSYRRAIAPYLGVEPDNVDAKYYENNLFTPRQMLTCLKLLYSEPERFPSIIETMQQAQPNEYFCQNEHRYTIAHKYGWNEENGIVYVNDCAIIPTQDPIIIVCFTAGLDRAEDFLTAFCTRCIDYTESVTVAREAAKEAERKAQEALAAKETEEKAAKVQAEQEAAEAQARAEAEAEQQAAELMASHARDGAVGLILVFLFALGFVCIVSFVLSILRIHAGSTVSAIVYLLLFLVSFSMLGFTCFKLFF